MNDLKFAFRQLLKNPGFTVVAMLTLALGIGANTAIFTVVNALLLRSLPVRNPEELVQVVTRSGSSEANSYSYPFRRRQRGDRVCSWPSRVWEFLFGARRDGNRRPNAHADGR